VFVLHDRWGTPTGISSSSTDEEWRLAQELYAAKTLRTLCLFFKAVDPSKLRDPGPQLQQVIAFYKQIETENKHLFKSYAAPGEFVIALERLLAEWLRLHKGAKVDGGSAFFTDSAGSVGPATRLSGSGFAYWLAESNRLATRGAASDPAGALFCAERAVAEAKGENEWARAESARGIARFHLNNLPGSVDSFQAIVDRLASSANPALRAQVATALVGKGVALGQLGRHAEVITVCNEVVARFGSAPEPALREQVANALFNKGCALSQLGRHAEIIAFSDEVLARFGSAPEVALREQVAKALVGKGIALYQLGRINGQNRLGVSGRKSRAASRLSIGDKAKA
jgi:tetratricopeptide (TPR) repeat protein